MSNGCVNVLWAVWYKGQIVSDIGQIVSDIGQIVPNT